MSLNSKGVNKSMQNKPWRCPLLLPTLATNVIIFWLCPLKLMVNVTFRETECQDHCWRAGTWFVVVQATQNYTEAKIILCVCLKRRLQCGRPHYDSVVHLYLRVNTPVYWISLGTKYLKALSQTFNFSFFVSGDLHYAGNMCLLEVNSHEVMKYGHNHQLNILLFNIQLYGCLQKA